MSASSYAAEQDVGLRSLQRNRGWGHRRTPAKLGSEWAGWYRAELPAASRAPVLPPASAAAPLPAPRWLGAKLLRQGWQRARHAGAWPIWVRTRRWFRGSVVLSPPARSSGKTALHGCKMNFSRPGAAGCRWGAGGSPNEHVGAEHPRSLISAGEVS